jgi:hypothetical protein
MAKADFRGDEQRLADQRARANRFSPVGFLVFASRYRRLAHSGPSELRLTNRSLSSKRNSSPKLQHRDSTGVVQRTVEIIVYSDEKAGRHEQALAKIIEWVKANGLKFYLLKAVETEG